MQAANGTQSTNNRTTIDNEVQQLLSQVDDIAKDTNFNGIRVLSSAQTLTLQAGPNPSETLVISVNGAKTNDLGVNNITVSSVAAAVSAPVETVGEALAVMACRSPIR